ncbi:hypothetical protein [Streptomyces chartreusis]|uniref:hypothetical protein n=1 Tax=Streptomyces chartreusis TaxID=1969 RepID=UPI00363D7CB8
MRDLPGRTCRCAWFPSADVIYGYGASAPVRTAAPPGVGELGRKLGAFAAGMSWVMSGRPKSAAILRHVFGGLGGMPGRQSE